MATAVLPADVNPNEVTRALASRTTKAGRRLHYELTCLQQPERARACGSGQKSAADRRPVDPPPVVQLRVLEGATVEDSKDITLSYNANFFCYVDLQHARPMANGRVQTPAATSPPVLTGAPVSGMAYLDRPAEAGYFLFPDLSVRHEGRYVLGFTLYEELKDEGDWDADPTDDDPTPGFFCRMRVLSNPFIVFSAKKFPGLTSSTSLSRTISEQGCRVRIRRDVRMRRREGKPSTNNDEYEKNGESRSRRARTPDLRKDQYQQARSASNSSEQRAPYPAVPVHERRPSEADAYPPPPPPGPAPSSHMRYGSDSSNNGYASQYIQPSQQAPPISPTASHFSSHPSPYTSAPPPPYSYHNRAAPSYTTPGNPPSTPGDMYERRMSVTSAVPPSPSHSHYAPKDDYRRESVYKHEPPPPEHRRDAHPLASMQSTPSTPPAAYKLPPLDSGRSRRPSVPSYGPSGYGPSPYMSSSSRGDYIEPVIPGPATIPEPARAGTKRAFNDTFSDNTSSALYDGQRPQDVHYLGPGRIGENVFDPENPEAMCYKRASGERVFKTPNAFYTS